MELFSSPLQLFSIIFLQVHRYEINGTYRLLIICIRGEGGVRISVSIV